MGTESVVADAGPLIHLHEVDALRLTDDLAARKAVKGLGVTPVGSLGVIVRACRIGMIDVPRAERTLLELHEHSTLFVTRAIIDLALDQLRHRP